MIRSSSAGSASEPAELNRRCWRTPAVRRNDRGGGTRFALGEPQLIAYVAAADRAPIELWPSVGRVPGYDECFIRDDV